MSESVEVGTDPFRKQLVVIKKEVFCNKCQYCHHSLLERQHHKFVKESNNYFYVCGKASTIKVDPINGNRRWKDVMLCEIKNANLNCEDYKEFEKGKIQEEFSFWLWIKSLFKPSVQPTKR